jgi:hypothetical protein
VGPLRDALLACAALDEVDPLQGVVHGNGHVPVDCHRVVPGDVDRYVPVAPQQ